MLFLLAEHGHQRGKAKSKTNSRFYRDEHGHILQCLTVREIIVQLRFGLDNSILLCPNHKNRTNNPKNYRLPPFPETKLQDSVDNDEQDQYLDDDFHLLLRYKIQEPRTKTVLIYRMCLDSWILVLYSNN